jgi:S1-C subfamily serine protease
MGMRLFALTMVVAAAALAMVGCAPRVGQGEPVLKDRVREAMRSTVGVVVGQGAAGTEGSGPIRQISGAGVIVAPELVATCAHVLFGPGGAPPAEVLVTLDSEWRDGPVPLYAGSIAWSDRGRDLALIKVPGLTAPAAPLGRGGDAPLGEEVFFVGRPSLDVNRAPAVGVGVVASHDFWTVLDDGPRVRMLRIDGSLNAGNSGGGIFSRTDGTLLGLAWLKVGAVEPIVEAMLSGKRSGLTPSASGVGFAVPIEELPARR